MELRHIRYFVAVADALNFTKAATRLRLAQPALSRQVADLEDELGVDLLKRTSHGVVLTEEGKWFLEEARGILKRVDESVTKVRALARGEFGELQVGYVPPLELHILPRALAEFQKTTPSVKVVLHDLGTDELCNALRNGTLHLALMMRPTDVVLVGHSYGGVVITEAGTHPKVSSLVYITAFAPDKGESVSSLIANPPPGAPVPPILPPKDGYLFLDRAKFAASFAADIEADAASFMADSQVPWGVEALAGAVTEPAWKTKPSFYLVATQDGMIPPPAQRAMAGRAKAKVTEVPGSHAIYVSKPVEVAEVIRQAAESSN